MSPAGSETVGPEAAVLAAAQQLGALSPRGDRWTHLSLCVLDAVFSIGARYSTTRRTVHTYAAHAGLTHVLEPAHAVAAGEFTLTEEPVTALRARIKEHGPETFARDVVRNRQRTSPRGGIPKAEAALGYATVLERHDVLRLADVPGLLVDDARLGRVEAALAQVPGHGAYGIRAGYLWMLAGSDDLIKPDRMVLGWLTGVLGRTPSVSEARTLLAVVATTLGVTAWQLDHAIWNAQRSMTRRRPR
jgi:hypothetical protein